MAAEHAALANCEIAELSYSASSGSTASSVCEQEEYFSSCIHWYFPANLFNSPSQRFSVFEPFNKAIYHLLLMVRNLRFTVRRGQMIMHISGKCHQTMKWHESENHFLSFQRPLLSCGEKNKAKWRATARRHSAFVSAPDGPCLCGIMLPSVISPVITLTNRNPCLISISITGCFC